MTKTINTRDIVYTPAQVSALTLRAAQEFERTKDFGLSFGLPGFDKEMLPARPGELITILALSSNWKTGLMQWVTRKTAASLDATGNECVVYVTWEVAIEELGLLDIANATAIDVTDMVQGKITDWEKLRAAAITRGTSPIYVIGHSLERRKSRPQLTLSNVALALKSLEDDLGLKPRMIALDYLQRMQREGDEEPRLQFARNVDRCKDMALAMGCPVLMGCQAKQDVMQRRVKLPNMSDGQETSNIMHTSDKIVGLWRPLVTEGHAGTVTLGPNNLPITQELLLVSIAKQRFGKVGGWWPLNVDFATNTVKGEIMREKAAAALDKPAYAGRRPRSDDEGENSNSSYW